MSELDLSPLYEAYYTALDRTDTKFVRYLYDRINWDARIVGIKGARGIGKTTLLLQRIKKAFGENIAKALYVSLDNLWFNENSLIDLVRHLNNRGIHNLFLDEIHKYPNWAQTLKNIYDAYPDTRIVYTGSSLLEIDHSKVDLSRRQTLYTMRCLSLREYLEYQGILSEDPIELGNILESHTSIARKITSKTDILRHFEDYLKRGCYPYFKNSGPDYMVHLRETTRLVIDSDVPTQEPFEYQTLEKMKRLLMIMARQVPFVPNIQALCGQISTNRNLGLKLLYLLDTACILRLITENLKSYKHLVKPEKVLFDNTNLMYAFCSNPAIGTLRETFFANQIEFCGSVTSPAKGYYLVNDKYLFEVGGRGKNFNQIKDIPNSYLAVDDIATGYGNHIPLWLLGFLY